MIAQSSGRDRSWIALSGSTPEQKLSPPCTPVAGRPALQGDILAANLVLKAAALRTKLYGFDRRPTAACPTASANRRCSSSAAVRRNYAPNSRPSRQRRGAIAELWGWVRQRTFHKRPTTQS